jgi:hypothetical protein
MVLTDRQRDDLHAGIYEYLTSRGDSFAAVAQSFAQVDPKAATHKTINSNGGGGVLSVGKTPLLEKKWTAIPRLQKKVLELERTVAQNAKIHAHRTGGGDGAITRGREIYLLASLNKAAVMSKDIETGNATEEPVWVDPPWHVMSKEDVFKELGLPDDIRTRGLTSEEAATRLEKYGPNKLSEKRKETLLEKIWKQINNVLVGILLFVAVVSGIRIATGADAVTNGIQIAIIIGVIV